MARLFWLINIRAIKSPPSFIGGDGGSHIVRCKPYFARFLIVDFKIYRQIYRQMFLLGCFWGVFSGTSRTDSVPCFVVNLRSSALSMGEFPLSGSGLSVRISALRSEVCTVAFCGSFLNHHPCKDCPAYVWQICSGSFSVAFSSRFLSRQAASLAVWAFRVF